MKKIYFSPAMEVVANDTRLVICGGSDKLEQTEEKADKNVDVLSKGRNDFDDDEEEEMMMMQSEQQQNGYLW